MEGGKRGPQPVIKIAGGIYKGRQLKVPAGRDTRPTTARTREGIFAVVQHEMTLHHARVLDLYAGSGALGMEALSRGATHVTFVEQRRTAAQTLQHNLTTLGVTATQSSVVRQPVRQFLRRMGRQTARARSSSPMSSSPMLSSRETDASRWRGDWSLVLMDPPYAATSQLETLELLVVSQTLRTGALIVLEGPATWHWPASDTRLKWIKTKTYGGSEVVFLLASDVS